MLTSTRAAPHPRCRWGESANMQHLKMASTARPATAAPCLESTPARQLHAGTNPSRAESPSAPETQARLRQIQCSLAQRDRAKYSKPSQSDRLRDLAQKGCQLICSNSTTQYDQPASGAQPGATNTVPVPSRVRSSGPTNQKHPVMLVDQPQGLVGQRSPQERTYAPTASSIREKLCQGRFDSD